MHSPSLQRTLRAGGARQGLHVAAPNASVTAAGLGCFKSIRQQCHPGLLHRARAVACRVSDEDDADLSLAELRQRLDAAVRQEQYQLAARLRDTISQRSVDVRLAVEDANTRFYNAFRSGNIKEMEAVWGEGEHVQVIHPAAECIAGREAVMSSWRSILAGVRPRAFRIDLEDVRVWATDTVGYVTCVEVVDADDSQGRIIVTNVYEKQGDRWLIVLHQGGPAPIRRRRSVGR